MRICRGTLLLIAAVLLPPARTVWAGPAPGTPAEERPVATTFHLFTDPPPTAPALPLENIPIGSSSEGGSPHLGRQSRMALRGERLLVTFRDDTLGIAALALSTDGGRTFSARRSSPVPGPILGAPEVAFGLGGELLFLATPPFSAVPRLARSSDGGDTFQEAYAVWTKLEAQNPRVAVDSGAASPHRGNLYLTAENFPFDYYGSTVLSRSTDGGQTFGEPTWKSDYWVSTGAPVVLPSGTVLVAERRWESGQVYRPTLSISRDGGRTFDPPRTAAFLKSSISSVAMTADSSGVIHLVFDAAPPDSGSDRSDVFYVRSTDGGKTFSEPRRVNDDEGTTSQTSPSIVAGPNGLLAVKWLDRRNDSGSDLLSDVYVAISTDGGLGFGRNLRVTDHNWPGIPPDAGGLVADPANFHLSWTDLRSGNQEIFYSYVPAFQPAAAADFSICPRNPYDVMLAGRSTTLELLTSALDGYSGDVELGAKGPPGGPVFTFDSGYARAGDRAELRVTTARDTPAGTYVVTATAEAQGRKRSTDIRINVHDPDRRATLPLPVSSARGVAQVISKPAIDRHGVITVAYADDDGAVSRPLVWFRRSYDRGRTFSAPVGTSLAIKAFAVDPDGGIYALHEMAGGLALSRSTDGGQTFTSSVTLADFYPAGTTPAPAIAADGAGRVVAAYFDYSAPRNLVVVQSSDGGATFAPAVSLEGPGSDFWIPSLDLAIDSSGTQFLCYAKSTSPRQAARLAVAPAGRPFGAPRDLASGTIFATRLSLGSDGVVHVAYMDNAGAHLLASLDGGSSFGAPVDVYGYANASTPFVVTDRGNAATVVWSAGDWARRDVFSRRSTDGGLSFGPISNLSTNPGNSANPVAVADGDGNVLILWDDDSPGRPRALAAWLPPAGISDVPPAAVILEPSIDRSIEAPSSVGFHGAAVSPDLTATFAYEWDFGDGSAGAGERVSHVFAVPGVHTVIFTVVDQAGRRASASRTITVLAPAASESDADLVLPVVTDSRGVGATHYTTELTLVSRSSRPVTAVLRYTAASGSGSGYASLTLAPGEERVIPDAIAFLRAGGLPIPDDGSPQTGTLRVLFRGAAPGEVFLGGRTSTPGGNGTYGLFYPSAATNESSLAVIGLQENDALRSNLALVNTGDSAVTLRVQLVGPNGEDLGALPDQTLDPLGWTQFNRPLRELASAGPCARDPDCGCVHVLGIRRPSRQRHVRRLLRPASPGRARGRRPADSRHPRRRERPRRALRDGAHAREPGHRAARAQARVHGRRRVRVGNGDDDARGRAAGRRAGCDRLPQGRRTRNPLGREGRGRLAARRHGRRLRRLRRRSADLHPAPRRSGNVRRVHLRPPAGGIGDLGRVRLRPAGKRGPAVQRRRREPGRRGRRPRSLDLVFRRTGRPSRRPGPGPARSGRMAPVQPAARRPRRDVRLRTRRARFGFLPLRGVRRPERQLHFGRERHSHDEVAPGA